MKMRRHWVLSLLVLSVLMFGLAAARAGQMLAAKPTAVAVVDVQAVLNGLKEREQINADLQTKAEKLKNEEAEKQKELEALNDDLKILDPGNDAFKAKQDEMEKKALDLQVWRAYQSRKLEGERTIQIENLYNKMTDAIARAAQQGGYGVVLYKEGPFSLKGAKPEEIGPAIASRKILWASDEANLSDQVKTMLNNEFVNQAK